MSDRCRPLASAGIGRRWRWSRAAALVLSGRAILSAAPSVGAQPPVAENRGKPFWPALAWDCAVPAGESAFGLVSEATSLLGSPDTEWRDDVGYGVVAACVYQKKLLKAEERRELVGRLSANPRRGIGETGADSVLLRSFSAPDLSIFSAVLTHAEDERLAAPLPSVVRRPDFDPSALDPWLARFVDRS